MFYLFFLIFILLCLAIFLSVFRSGEFRVFAKVFRWTVVIFSIAVFAFFFISRSLDSFRDQSVALQVANKLPIPLDFYLIKLNDSISGESKYVTSHLGKIRSNYFRTEFLDMKNSDQFWVVAFMGKKNLVYFSQHSVPDKKSDQTVEVKNYIIQSTKLSAIAKDEISAAQLDAGKTSVWITLDFLMIFLNLGLLLRREKKVPNKIREQVI